ncbi:MAG TPA: hypothetical protein VFW44_20885 [Bryobacteraceae bacterium]|nr:hypothetical protein [Bryobacteraceae bacterium]
MKKPFLYSALAALVLTFPFAALADNTVTLSSGAGLNLDTNAKGASGGDITWTGSTVTYQGSASGVDLASTPLASGFSGQAGYNQLLQIAASAGVSTLAAQFGSFLTTSAITPAVNDILVIKTNTGGYSAMLVTSISSGSITLQYKTFGGSSTGGGGGTPGGPTISGLSNNYSGIPSGLPSYGIAPGSLFIIYGSGLSDPGTPKLQSSAAPGLPTTLNHTSISVTVNGKTTTPAIYYTSPTQVAAVLPSSTPAGKGAITVTYNGKASNAADIVVPAGAFGIDTLYGTGAGPIVATVGANVILPTSSASPGETITIWGSGLGADTANDDRTFPLKQDNLGNVQVYIGDVKATVEYAGRSQYPGVDQVNVVVPSGLSGCGLSVAVVANGKVSNFGTLPVNAGGGICADPQLGITGTDLQQLGGKTTVRSGTISLFQNTAPKTDFGAIAGNTPKAQTFETTYTAGAFFSSSTGSSYASGSSFVSFGSCIVTFTSTPTGGGTGTSNGLDAGNPITMKGGGQNVQLTDSIAGHTIVGSYFAQLTSPLTGGSSYTFTGPGGKDVGPFTATVNFPIPLTWTNENSISTVTESKGQLITWTGGATGTYVYISGDSSSSDGSVSADFVCIAPVSAEQFTIPSYVLLSLPAGTGSLGVSNYSNLGTFTATGIDHGSISSGVSSSEDVTYQ